MIPRSSKMFRRALIGFLCLPFVQRGIVQTGWKLIPDQFFLQMLQLLANLWNSTPIAQHKLRLEFLI